MEVKISMMGDFFDPHVVLPAFFEPLELPVKKLKMIISEEPFEILVTEMEIVLELIRNHYGEHLKSFKLEVYNEKKESFDQSLIKLVRDCPHLVHVEISVLYNSNDTAETIDKIISERRPPPLVAMVHLEK